MILFTSRLFMRATSSHFLQGTPQDINFGRSHSNISFSPSCLSFATKMIPTSRM